MRPPAPPSPAKPMTAAVLDGARAFGRRLTRGLAGADEPGGEPPGADHRRLLAAKQLASALPDLLVEATRVAATVAAGWHGRRRAGPGETFWQYRPYFPGEPAQTIDWRRSARDDELSVREREWQAAHTVWLAPDLSPSMDWRSPLVSVTKRDRAVVLTLALADLLGRAGERVGVPGIAPPRADRRASDRLAEALARAPTLDLPDPAPIGRLTDVVAIGDFLMAPEAIEARLVRISAAGARLHLLRVVDPGEALPPWRGNVDYRDPETGERVEARRAEALTRDWTRRWAAHGEALTTLARRHGWRLTTHASDRSAAEPLLALHAALGGLGHGHAREPRRPEVTA